MLAISHFWVGNFDSARTQFLPVRLQLARVGGAHPHAGARWGALGPGKKFQGGKSMGKSIETVGKSMETLGFHVIWRFFIKQHGEAEEIHGKQLEIPC